MPDGNGTRSVVTSVLSLADYQKQGGFTAHTRATSSGRGSSEILTEIRTAKLRGRGGAGMLTADKWQVVLDQVVKRGGPPQLVCNAYDADPRSLVATTLLATQPFTVLEGIVLAAYALGANEAYMYMHSKNRNGYDAFNAAVHQAQDSGVLGNLTVTIVGVDVGFMGGEESTMLEVIRGRRAMAVQRPPYPAQSGLSELPTAIANVETLSHIVTIMNNGAQAYVKAGSKDVAGTKLVTVYDAQGQGTVVEVSMGMPIATILQKAGIAITPENARGVVVGGPEGGVLPAELWNTPFDFDSLKSVGTILGSATIEVLPKSTCMVEWSRSRTDYLAQASCGKCIPCRTGVKRATGVLAGIMSDVGNQSDVAVLQDLAEYIPSGSLCGFGWNATHPMKTAMRYFADDFTKHLNGECPTGTCFPVRTHRFALKKVL